MTDTKLSSYSASDVPAFNPDADNDQFQCFWKLYGGLQNYCAGYPKDVVVGKPISLLHTPAQMITLGYSEADIIQPIGPPDHPANPPSTATTQFQWAHKETQKRDIDRMNSDLASILRLKVPAAYFSSIRHAFTGISECSAREMFQVLYLKYGVPSTAAYANAANTMALPFNGTESLSAREFTARYLEAAAVFARVPSETISANAQCTQLKRHFSQYDHYLLTLHDYERTHDGVAAQNVAELVEAINSRSDQASTATTGAFAGATTHSAVETRLAALETLLTATLAENKHLKQQIGQRSKQGQPAAPTPMPKKRYCHSCGTNFDHGSRRCPAPKAGHKVDASYFNKMGGAESDS